MRLVDERWLGGRLGVEVHFLVSGRDGEVAVTLSRDGISVVTADYTGKASYAVEPRAMTADDDAMALLTQYAKRPVGPRQVTWWLTFQDGREWPASSLHGWVEVINEGG